MNIFHDVISSLRRILKRGVGTRNFRKFEKNKDLNQKLYTQNQSDFSPKIRWRAKKKKVFTQISSDFKPKRGCKPRRNAQNIPFVWSNLMPNLQRGGHASFLHTILCNYTILATQRGGHGAMPPPLNTPLVMMQCFYTVCTMFMSRDRITLLICRQIISC